MVGGFGCLALIMVFVAGGFVVAKFLPHVRQAVEEYLQDKGSNPDKAAAKLGIRMIPQVQILREDDEAKTITFKAGPEGEELTMHYEGLSTGKKSPRVTNSKGEEVTAPGRSADKGKN